MSQGEGSKNAESPPRSSPRNSPRGAAAGSTGRPRSEQAHQAILDATLELLVEVGFSALTVEGVAQRAGVGESDDLSALGL